MEGPSLLILKQELSGFLNRRVIRVGGNTKQPKDLLKGCKLTRVDTWGKNLFLHFEGKGRPALRFVTKTHFLMFGSYRINEPRPDRSPRLELTFQNGVVDFYSCSMRFIEDDYLKDLDQKTDLMSEQWDISHVLGLMRLKKNAMLCDLLLDQTVFTGSGNIIKNEVLFNIRRHPLTRLSQILEKDWPKLAEAVHAYCWNFYEWKKKFELRKHWQVYRQSTCPLCGTKLTREKLGKFQRRTFYCPQHQPMRSRLKRLTVHPVLPMKPSTQPEARLDH